MIALLAALAAASQPVLVPRSAAERALLAADERQRAAVGNADLEAIRSGSHENLRINAPSNRVLTRDDLVRMVDSGEIRNEVFERTAESITVTGNVGVVMGHERMFPGAASEQARIYGLRTLDRRYTNIYLLERGAWKHIARHANVIPSAGDAQIK
jgi:hypothetical protein